MPEEAKPGWNGAWIWPDAREKGRNCYAMFRRTFEAERDADLEIKITADSFYTLYLDGEWICRGPARAPLSNYQYDSFHMKIRRGRHCIAVLAHHIGEINATVMTGRPGLLADVRLRCGSACTDIGTGPDWRCMAADAWRQELPCTMSHFGFWEDCDLRKIPAGWTGTDYDDRGWTAPAVIGRPPCVPWMNLAERDIPPLRLALLPSPAPAASGCWNAGAIEPILSKTVAARTRISDREPVRPLLCGDRPGNNARYFTFDFGKTVSGYICLRFNRSADGAVADVSYDDLLGPSQAVNPERSYLHSSDRFILPAGGCEIRGAHPRGFRYVTVDVWSPSGTTELADLSAWEELYPFDMHNFFACSDPALERYAAKAAETVRLCSTDAFLDCTTRERVQWMEDLYMHGHVSGYAFGDTRLLRRALIQGAQCQLPDGRINGFMPSERINCAFASSSLSWLCLLSEYWMFSGDETVMELLPAARRLMALFESLQDGDGLIASWPAGQFWDWAPIEGSGCLLLTNAFLIWALERIGRHDFIRNALGDRWFGMQEKLRLAAHKRFWDSGRQLYRDACPPDGRTPIFSQDANAIAVLGGVCPAAERAALLRRITDPALLGPVPIGEDSLKENRRPSPDLLVPVGTPWFGHFLCQALFEEGLDELALGQMRLFWGAHDDLPTFPETRIQHGNTFLCHGWSAGPAFLLPAYVVGVRPSKPGWKAARVSPHPANLESARASILTPNGMLDVAWRRDGSRCKVTVENAPTGCDIEIV